MTYAEARARVMTLVDSETDPVLASADIDVLLDMAKEVDINGVRPGETGWENTYNVHYAVAQGWLLKAGRLANRYLFMTGGKMFSRQQYYDHCMKLYRTYLGKSGLRSVRLSGPDDRLDYVPNNFNY